MSLSRDDSTSLWHSVQTRTLNNPYEDPFEQANQLLPADNLNLFNSVNNKLLNPPGSALRHIPMKVYLPTVPTPAGGSAAEMPQPGSIRVVQSLVAPQTSSSRWMFDAQKL